MPAAGTRVLRQFCGRQSRRFRRRRTGVLPGRCVRRRESAPAESPATVASGQEGESTAWWRESSAWRRCQTPAAREGLRRCRGGVHRCVIDGGGLTTRWAETSYLYSFSPGCAGVQCFVMERFHEEDQIGSTLKSFHVRLHEKRKLARCGLIPLPETSTVIRYTPSVSNS